MNYCLSTRRRNVTKIRPDKKKKKKKTTLQDKHGKIEV